jgi:hypothetical protein
VYALYKPDYLYEQIPFSAADSRLVTENIPGFYEPEGLYCNNSKNVPFDSVISQLNPIPNFKNSYFNVLHYAAMDIMPPPPPKFSM